MKPLNILTVAEFIFDPMEKLSGLDLKFEEKTANPIAGDTTHREIKYNLFQEPTPIRLEKS